MFVALQFPSEVSLSFKRSPGWERVDPVKPPHGKKGIRLTVVFRGFVGDEISYPIFMGIISHNKPSKPSIFGFGMFVFGAVTPPENKRISTKKGPGLQREIHLNLPTLNIVQMGGKYSIAWSIWEIQANFCWRCWFLVWFPTIQTSKSKEMSFSMIQATGNTKHWWWFFLFADFFCSCPGYVFFGWGELEVDYHVHMGIRNRLIEGSWLLTTTYNIRGGLRKVPLDSHD